MSVQVVIHPKIEVIAPKQIEVSFDEEETNKNKALLKAQGNVATFEKLNYSDFNQLLSIITEQIDAYWQIVRVRSKSSSLAEMLQTHELSVAEMLETLKLVPELKKLYALPQPVWEGYTTEQHCLGVATTLVALAPTSEKAWLWSIAGLLHDLGKAVASSFVQDAKLGRQLQYFYNYQLAETILKALAFSIADSAYILTLISDSSLPFLYVTNQQSLPAVENNLITSIDGLADSGYQTSPLELLADLKAMWLADGADYTALACWLKGLPLKPSFDGQFIFTFTQENSQWRLSAIRPKQEWEEKYHELVEKITTSSTHPVN